MWTGTWLGPDLRPGSCHANPVSRCGGHPSGCSASTGKVPVAPPSLHAYLSAHPPSDSQTLPGLLPRWHDSVWPPQTVTQWVYSTGQIRSPPCPATPPTHQKTQHSHNGPQPIGPAVHTSHDLPLPRPCSVHSSCLKPSRTCPPWAWAATGILPGLMSLGTLQQEGKNLGPISTYPPGHCSLTMARMGLSAGLHSSPRGA